MNALSGLDSMFLYSETPTTPMNVIATITLDSRTSDTLLDYEAIVARLEDRLPSLPHFRRKLAEAPFGLDHGVWVDVHDLDLRHHVMRVLAREPGGRDELAEVVEKAAHARLDRSRPLWSFWVVEGLTSGKLAIVIRVHHALLDGISGSALLLHLFDRCEADSSVRRIGATRNPHKSTSADNPATRMPSPLTLLRRVITRLPDSAGRSFDAVKKGGGLVLRLAMMGWQDRNHQRRPVVPFSCSQTHFNGAVSQSRRIAYSRVPMGDVSEIRAIFGCTLNDVVLAGCTAALRQHLLEHGELTGKPLIAAIPVSTRTHGHEHGGNRISAMLVRLPVQFEDPVMQLVDVGAETRVAKRFHKTLGGDTIASLAGLFPPFVPERVLQLYSRFELANYHRPVANLTISTVAGPRRKLRLGGAQVEAIHPHGPLMEGLGINITTMCYAGSIDIGVLACSTALPNPRALADSIATGIEELAKLARQAPPERSGER